ncbi:hypothetical protein KM427_19910 [Nocardioides sp. LMS-CY]|uniref:hypothetical protein n=1 Tax=Nocardioides sp. (strain LMS-CY) TaxID=2840457 RepID=UPI001C000B20|nr:hypothetical protein [Nocardioides sp. LMS-CY]QWF21187.1 hypothetical protein KM427_19910 [Nocardioides sp. LMS-CY]
MLPDRKDIKDLFEGLLGREVALTDGTPVDLGIPKPIVASYLDDTHGLRAVAVMSFGLAARSGAAIALIPKGAAQAAEEDRLLPVNLFENAAEICNVLAAPLGEAMDTHLRLAETFAPSDPVPAHLLALAAQAGGREDLELDISGYGTGGLSIAVAV